jgi:hypothetical protein
LCGCNFLFPTTNDPRYGDEARFLGAAARRGSKARLRLRHHASAAIASARDAASLPLASLSFEPPPLLALLPSLFLLLTAPLQLLLGGVHWKIDFLKPQPKCGFVDPPDTQSFLLVTDAYIFFGLFFGCVGRFVFRTLVSDV